MQTLANKGVKNLIKQMAILNHENKFVEKLKLSLENYWGAKAPPQPPAPRSLHSPRSTWMHENVLFSCLVF